MRHNEEKVKFVGFVQNTKVKGRVNSFFGTSPEGRGVEEGYSTNVSANLTYNGVEIRIGGLVFQHNSGKITPTPNGYNIDNKFGNFDVVEVL